MQAQYRASTVAGAKILSVQLPNAFAGYWSASASLIMAAFLCNTYIPRGVRAYRIGDHPNPQLFNDRVREGSDTVRSWSRYSRC